MVSSTAVIIAMSSNTNDITTSHKYTIVLIWESPQGVGCRG